MVAAARLALLELATIPAAEPKRQVLKYYATRREAQWGC